MLANFGLVQTVSRVTSLGKERRLTHAAAYPRRWTDMRESELTVLPVFEGPRARARSTVKDRLSWDS